MAPKEETVNRFVTYTDWDGYSKFLDAVGEGRTKVTYDRGTLELMTPGFEHEHIKELIGGVLHVILRLTRTMYRSGGGMTFRRKDLDRGLEPYGCYWIQHCQQVTGIKVYDANTHPPPDLVVEIDVTSSSIDRMDIYRTLRVPEVWRWKDDRINFNALGKDGKYLQPDHSPTFPDIPREVLARFVAEGRNSNTAQAVWGFEDWLRDNLG